MKDKINKRREFNLKLVDKLKAFFETEKDLRFIQGLWALKIIDRKDRFYEESVDTFERINEKK